MSQTVEAIGYKADVPARTKDAVTGKVESMKSKVSEAASRVGEAVTGTTSKVSDVAGSAAGRVGDATPSTGDVKRNAKRAVGIAQENPLGLAVGAMAAGFLAGMLLPSTKVEDERMGAVADQVKDLAKQHGQEALDRGKDVAQQVAQTAVQTAKEEGQAHGEDMAASVKESAQEVKSSTE